MSCEEVLTNDLPCTVYGTTVDEIKYDIVAEDLIMVVKNYFGTVVSPNVLTANGVNSWVWAQHEETKKAGKYRYELYSVNSGIKKEILKGTLIVEAP